MKHNKPLDLSERKNIEKLIENNLSLSKISRIISRGRNTVISEVRINGGRLNYNALKADENHKKKMIEANLKREKISKEQIHPMTKIKSKLENLEMQIEILTDVIFEIRKKLGIK